MRMRIRIEPEAAPLWRRLFAGTVDTAAWTALAGLAAAIAMVRLPPGERLERIYERTQAIFGDPRTIRGLKVGTPVVNLLTHGLRSPGQRAAGIRRIDARTGGRESPRSALIRIGLGAVLSLALHRLNRPGRERMEHRRADMDARLTEVRAQFGDDPEALERATTEIERDGGRGCASAMIQALALGWAQPLSALLSPRRQTVIERIAGVAVVRDRTAAGR
jgi:hypothetical protein